MSDLWERRLRRAVQLEAEWPFAGEILAFFRRILALQAGVARHVAASGARRPEDYPLTQLASFVVQVLGLVAETGPEVLARASADLLRLPGEVRAARVLGGNPQPGRAWGRGDIGFFTMVFLQPYLASLPLDPMKGDLPPGACPSCGGRALAALLREDRADGARRRALLCSLCSREWGSARVGCPACGEERPERLPRFEAEEIGWIRIEACDTCRKYLKGVDFSKGPGAEPVVDELASTPLDVIARDRGYMKFSPNFAGF